MHKVTMLDVNGDPVMTAKTDKPKVCYSMDAAKSIELGASVPVDYDSSGRIISIRPKTKADVKAEAVAAAKDAKAAYDDAAEKLKDLEPDVEAPEAKTNVDVEVEPEVEAPKTKTNTKAAGNQSPRLNPKK